MKKTSLTTFFFACSFLFAILDMGYAQGEEKEMKVFSTLFCTVFYEEGVELKTVNNRINLRFCNFYSPRRHKGTDPTSIEEILSEKLDAIFTRVEDILDMYPSRIHVTIKIYKARQTLDRIYEDIFGEKNTADSFYIYKTNTIYTLENFINEGVLAHEMAHCIIDHYFVILPPRKIQEMLAVYADVHLKD